MSDLRDTEYYRQLAAEAALLAKRVGYEVPPDTLATEVAYLHLVPVLSRMLDRIEALERLVSS